LSKASENYTKRCMSLKSAVIKSEKTYIPSPNNIKHENKK